jgi:hypothetical protein
MTHDDKAREMRNKNWQVTRDRDRKWKPKENISYEQARRERLAKHKASRGIKQKMAKKMK